MDYSTLTPFPAPPRHYVAPRPAWAIGLVVTACVTVAGMVLGPVAGVVLFDLSPLYPLTLVLGAAVGATYGLVVGIVAGVVTAVTVVLTRPPGGAGR